MTAADQEVLVVLCIAGALLFLLLFVFLLIVLYNFDQERVAKNGAQQTLRDATDNANQLSAALHQSSTTLAEIANLRVKPNEVLATRAGNLSVDGAGYVTVPQVGKLYTRNLNRADAIYVIDMFDHLQKQVEQVRARALLAGEQQLQTQNAPIAKNDWRALHQMYLDNHIRFDQQGRILYVFVHGDPSGEVQIEWTVQNYKPSYRVHVYHRGNNHGPEFRERGRLNCTLPRGSDEVFEFAVYDDDEPLTDGRKPTNLEPSFKIIVNVPTKKQWQWLGLKAMPSAGTLVAELQEAKTEALQIESEVNAMGGTAEDAQFAKAAALSRRIQSSRKRSR